MQIRVREITLLLSALLMPGCAQHPKSNSEFISEQIIPCWNFDPSIQHPENYMVRVRIQVRPDGSIAHAEIGDPSRLQDPVYRSVADAALRAVENPRCQPLHFPSGKYWPTMDFVFDLEKAINGGY